ncbi:choice-of-anchor D domain-containing protein [Rufibacter aurantiacus]|uniref:choice-of-anchor D domain-containing protein n=1 Tax=Rufibacter aurantiacus TaxID=2817374 RepID=UPI001B315F19|nr:choice-of-anchor D domain-containing protein [Rufibacter aurantiacus]
MEKNLLRRSASGEKSVSRAWLFLVLMLCGMASVLQAQAQVTSLPTAYGGNTAANATWSSALPTGWTVDGPALSTYTNNLGGTGTYVPNGGVSTQYNSGLSKSAAFTTQGSSLTINYSTAPQRAGKLTFVIAYKLKPGMSGDFDGSFEVQQSKDGIDWASLPVLRTFGTGGTKIVLNTTTNSDTASAKPDISAKYIRFHLKTPSNASQVLLDKVLLADYGPEIDLFSGTSTQQASGSTYTFAPQNINTTSAPVTFTIQNTGTQNLSLPTSLALSGANADQFEITEQPSTNLVAPGGSTSFKVVFKPTSVLGKVASISIANNDADENPYIINLAGSGVAGPEVNLFSGTSTQHASGSTYTFVNQQNINTTSAPVTFTIQNTGTQNLSLPTSLALSGANADQFEITEQPSTNLVVPGGSTSFKVVFKPTSVLGKVASISIANNDADENPYIINLAGSGVLRTPTITDFDPAEALAGATIKIIGTDLTNTVRVRFKGSSVDASITITDKVITANVPPDAETGPVTIFYNGGAAERSSVSTKDFIILKAPVITSFSPVSGPVGTRVTITGANFSKTGYVYFKDEAGEFVSSDVYEYVSSTEIITDVPVGAASGTLLVAGADYAESTDDFTVTVISPAPTITKVDPNSGPVGTIVTILGNNLVDITAVTFGGIAAEFDDTDPTGLVTVVPPGAKSGDLVVTNSGGSAQSSFLVLETSTLPVELVNLKATSTAKGSILTWQTASEKDNDFFEVQSASDPKDEFKTIAQVDSKVTNSSALTSYNYVDNTFKTGITYYRLKQVDLNGKFEYSKVVAVKATANNSSELNSVKVYPNPFNGSQNLNVEIEATQSGELNVVLYYVTGKKAFEQTFKVEKGASIIEIPVSKASLPVGLYILSTEVNNQVTTTRVVKQ